MKQLPKPVVPATLIGIAGRGKSGKNTVGNLIAKHVAGPPVVQLGFADPVKRFVKEMFDFTEYQINGDGKDTPDPRYVHMARGALGSTGVGFLRDRATGKFNCTGTVYAGKEALFEALADENGYVPHPFEDVHLTPRHALQQLGSQWGRECYRDVWVDYALRRARDFCEIAHALVVITDVRFLNEAWAIRAVGGHVWHIARPDAGLPGDAAAHDSEAEVDSEEMLALATWQINNDTALGMLDYKVELGLAWSGLKKVVP